MLAAVSTPFSRMALVALCQSVGVRTAVADACAHPTMARVRASVAVASVDRFEQLHLIGKGQQIERALIGVEVAVVLAGWRRGLALGRIEQAQRFGVIRMRCENAAQHRPGRIEIAAQQELIGLLQLDARFG